MSHLQTQTHTHTQTHIKNEYTYTTQNVTNKYIPRKYKYMSLKEIEDTVANPKFGENIEIDTSYSAYQGISLFQDLNFTANANTYISSNVYPGHNSYQGKSLDQDYNNYNLKPPVYTVPIPPVYAIPIPSFSNTGCIYSNTDSRVSERDYTETSFLKTKKGIFVKIGSNVLIKKTYYQYNICINHKGTIKKILKKDNGHWYFFVEIENEEIKKQIIKIHHYLEKNNDKKFKYPFFKDINQEKSWIVISNKTENFELIESSNESKVTSTNTVTTSASVSASGSTSASSSASVSVSASSFELTSAAHFANINAEILAAAAISARLKAKSDAFWNVCNTLSTLSTSATLATSATSATSASSATSAISATSATLATTFPASKKQKIV